MPEGNDDLHWDLELGIMLTPVPEQLLQLWINEMRFYPNMNEAMTHLAFRAAHWGMGHGVGHALRCLEPEFYITEEGDKQLVLVEQLLAWAAVRHQESTCDMSEALEAYLGSKGDQNESPSPEAGGTP